MNEEIPDEEIRERIEKEREAIEALETLMEMKQQLLDDEITSDEAVEIEKEVFDEHGDNPLLR